MNKHQAEATEREMEAAGWTVTARRKHRRGAYSVDAVAPDGEPTTIDVREQWTERNTGMRPTPGARLKYAEPTTQVSITVPVSVLAAADAGGRGKRSAWFVAAAREKMQREGAG